MPGLGELRDELKSDRVVAILESRILSGQLKAGDRLPTEGELCEALGVSRSVVRDAIRNLAARGLVSVRQGQGTSVAEPDDAALGRAIIALLARSDLTFGQVADARAAIETRLIPLAAASVTDGDLASLDATFATFSAAVEGGDWDLARDSHLDLHVGLLAALHQPALELILKPMTEVILISSTPPRRGAREDWEVPSHVPILAALRARDPAGLEAAMREHFAVSSEPKRYSRLRARPFRDVFAEQGSEDNMIL